MARGEGGRVDLGRCGLLGGRNVLLGFAMVVVVQYIFLGSVEVGTFVDMVH